LPAITSLRPHTALKKNADSFLCLDNFTGFFDGAGPDVDMSTVRSVQKKLARIMNVMGLPVLAR